MVEISSVDDERGIRGMSFASSYQVRTDKRSGIGNEPNRVDDPEYIVKLIEKVTTVSLETVKIVESLPAVSHVADREQRRSSSDGD